MTPAERKRAQEVCDKATPGPWSFADESWVGASQFWVYANDDDGKRRSAVFGNIEIDMNGLNNLAFVTEARTLLPKALMQIEAWQGDIENMKAGFAKTSAPIMSIEEIKRAKEITAQATQGEWAWENEDKFLGPNVVTLYAGRGPMAHGLNLFGRFDGGTNRDNDLAFITEARALLPKALDHMEKLSNAVQRMRRPGLVLRPPSYKPPAPKPPAPKPPGM
jgi:hypothetical protein